MPQSLGQQPLGERLRALLPEDAHMHTTPVDLVKLPLIDVAHEQPMEVAALPFLDLLADVLHLGDKLRDSLRGKRRAYVHPEVEPVGGRPLRTACEGSVA